MKEIGCPVLLSEGTAEWGKLKILGLIGKGYFASSTMAEEIPPRVAYDNDNLVNIQLLAAYLRLAMGFNLAAPETINHLRKLLPPTAIFIFYKSV